MDVSSPLSTIMSKHVSIVQHDDRLELVKQLMEGKQIHHVPVCEGDKLVGIISHTDLKLFLKGNAANAYQEMMNTIRLRNYTAAEIMTSELVTLKPDDSIQKALQIFKKNEFKAIPIVEQQKIIGLLTTYDIIKALLASFHSKSSVHDS